MRKRRKLGDLYKSYKLFKDEIEILLQNKEELKEKQSQIEAIIKAFDGFIYICSQDYTVEYMNDKLIKRTGYDGTGEKCYKVLHNLDSKCPWCVNDEVFKGNIVKWQIKSPKDNRWYYIVNSPLYHSDGRISKQSLIVDITEHKEAELKLKQSEEKFKNLAEESPNLIFIIQNKKILYVNKKIENLTGFKKEEIENSNFNFWELIPKEYYNNILNNYKTLLKTKKSVQFECQIRHKDNYFLNVIVSINLIKYDSKDAILGQIIDITEYKKIENELKKEKEKLSFTIKNISEGIVTLDKNLNIILLNKSAEKFFNISAKTDLNKNLLSLLHFYNEEEKYKFQKILNRTLNSKKIAYSHNILTLKYKQEKIFSYSCSPIKDNDESIGLVLVFKDITEKKKLEEKIQKANKLESLSLFASGIAHDFNNILVGILGYITMGKSCEKKDDLLKILDNIEKITYKAKDLINQLITFSKNEYPDKKRINLKNFLNNYLDTNKFPYNNINISYEIDDNLWDLAADENQLSQIFDNLIKNSYEARINNCNILIKASNFENIKKNIDFPTGKFVNISLIDNGKGIKRRDINKIFDPYFTTKYHGSGLGLSSVYSIVKNHSGFIEVKSEYKKGTIFNIYLPAFHSEDTLENNEKTKDNPSILKNKKILLMDDDSIVRMITKELLIRSGYEVTDTSNGEDAINIYKNEKIKNNGFDVVILDLNIRNGMSGKTIIKRLLEFDPEVKAILISGYLNKTKENYKNLGFKASLMKPFKLEDLINIIENI